MSELTTHELGHGIGFDHPLPEDVGTTDCIMFVGADPKPWNITPCNHERQSVFWSYSLRQTGPDLKQPMYLANVYLSPQSATIFQGATQQFSGSAPTNEQNPATELDWTFTNPSIASFVSRSNSGAIVSGDAPGQTQLNVKALEAPWIIWPTSSTSATITVQTPPPPPPPPPPPVASVAITPSSVTLVYPNDGSLTATAYDAQGNVIPNVTWQWSVRDTSKIYFVPSGSTAWIAPKLNGTTQVYAVAGGMRATAVITVQNCPTRCYA